MGLNFFTNQGDNTLYNKFVRVFENMQNIEYFKSVIGYFRASGYFAIRKHFPDTLKVKIIAGINVDPFIALAQKQGLLFNLNAKDAKQSFYESIQEDILNAKYGKNIEEGILQLIQDIGEGRIEIEPIILKNCTLNFTFSCHLISIAIILIILLLWVRLIYLHKVWG